MKHLKRFNESNVDQTDLQDIDDLFKEVADKHLIKRVFWKRGEDLRSALGHKGQNDDLSKYVIAIHGDQIIIDVELSKPGSSLLVPMFTTVSNWDNTPDSKIVDDILLFCDRVKGIGYKIDVDRDFLYKHPGFSIRIYN